MVWPVAVREVKPKVAPLGITTLTGAMLPSPAVTVVPMEVPSRARLIVSDDPKPAPDRVACCPGARYPSPETEMCGAEGRYPTEKLLRAELGLDE